jgi:hypothetical protein
MIDRLDHDDDVMAQVRALTDKVNELVDAVNGPHRDALADLLVCLVDGPQFVVDQPDLVRGLLSNGFVSVRHDDRVAITDAGRRWLVARSR